MTHSKHNCSLYIRIWIILFTCFSRACGLTAQTGCHDSFAVFLQKKGEYYRAITEYYRLIYLCNDSSHKIQYLKNIGLCYMQGEDYDGFIAFYGKHQSDFLSNAVIEAEMILYDAESHYQQQYYGKAIRILEHANPVSETRWATNIKMLLGLCYARTFDWQSAVRRMEEVQKDSPEAEHLARSLSNFPKLPKKHPWIAGSLSTIIPGTGYMYCNQRRTGLTALLVNGLFFWAIQDAVSNKQYGIAAAAGFLSIGWYLGNIKGSVDAANRYNDHVRHAFINQLLERQNMNRYVKRD